MEDNNKLISGRSTHETDTAATDIAGILELTPFDNSTEGMPDLARRNDSSSKDTDGSKTVPTPTAKNSSDETDDSSQTVPTPTDKYTYDEEGKLTLEG